MKEHWRNAILVLPLTLVLFAPVAEISAAGGQQQPGPGAGKPKAAVLIDLTGPRERSSGPVSLPGFRTFWVPGAKPVDDSLPVRLGVESLESKAGKQILKIHLVNQSERPLDIPVALSGGTSAEAQEGSTSFLFYIILSVPGSNESFSRPLVSSSDSDAKHSKVVLPPGEEAVILLPLPAYIFRAKDVKAAPELVARVSLSELKIRKQEYMLESVRRAQSVSSVTLSAEKIQELGKSNVE